MKKLILLCAVAVAAVGCTKHNRGNDGRFTCFLPRMTVTTKAEIEVNTAESFAKLTWNQDDKVMINGVPYVISNWTEDLSMGEFTSVSASASVPEAPYKVCFPADSWSPLGIILPKVQHYSKDGVLEDGLPLYAMGTDYTLKLKNVCGILSIHPEKTLAQFGKNGINRVEVTADQPLFGLWSPEESEFVTPEEGALVLDCGEGLKSDWICIGVPAGRYTNLVYKIYSASGEVSVIREDVRVVKTADVSDFKGKAENEMAFERLSLYMNYLYGTPDWTLFNEIGTDEYTWSDNTPAWADSTLDKNGMKLLPDNEPLRKIWGVSYSCINLANLLLGEIDKAKGDDELISPAVTAEANFYRALSYFNLVRIFGGVPVVTKYSAEIFKELKERNTVEEIYKFIFEDLEKSVNSLPDIPRYAGGPNKNAARLLSAQAYLTFGWWNENPNNIPTYPEETRGTSTASSYFQKAYDIADAAIKNPVIFKLMDTFAEVNLAQNDFNNNEVLLYADHRRDAEALGLPSYGWDLGTPCNLAGQQTNWHYDNAMIDSVNVLFVDDCQHYGYPASTMAPVPDALKKFTDVDKDSRWDGTFTTVCRANWDKVGYDEQVIGPQSEIKPGAPVLEFLSYDDSNIKYDQKNLGLNFGTLEQNHYYVNISDVSRSDFPAMHKMVNDFPGRATLGDPISSSKRPSPIFKFSELHLIKAEAAVKVGKNSDSRDFVNILRARAGKWKFQWSEKTDEQLDSELSRYSIYKDDSAELVAATPSTMTIDYILDERLREFWGEGLRRFDLIRTQTFHERAKVHHISLGHDRDPKEVVRGIFPEAYLCPIPQAQVDLSGIKQLWWKPETE